MTERTASLFMMSMMRSVFSDTASSVWAPLIEEVRPKGKTPPKNLRRTISAIFWRHQNGAKWRTLPFCVWSLVDCRTVVHSLVEA
ncbi:transposase [Komagataeibacter oboediens]|uniref:transposase n=1 Tax=Komagataeibacter oboediens TaxID=65958 RepID=UPI0038D25977